MTAPKDPLAAAEETERQRRAIEAIAKTGVCYMNPKTMSEYKRRAVPPVGGAEPEPMYRVRVVLSPYLPDGVWSADLRFLPVEAITEPLDEALLAALSTGYKIREQPGEPGA